MIFIVNFPLTISNLSIRFTAKVFYYIFNFFLIVYHVFHLLQSTIEFVKLCKYFVCKHKPTCIISLLKNHDRCCSCIYSKSIQTLEIKERGA